MWFKKKKVKKESPSYWDVQLEIQKGYNENRQHFEDNRVYREFVRHESEWWINHLFNLYSSVKTCRDLPEVTDFEKYQEEYDSYVKKCDKFLSGNMKLSHTQYIQFRDHPTHCWSFPGIRLSYSTLYTVYDNESAKYKDNMMEKLNEEFYKDLK